MVAKLTAEDYDALDLLSNLEEQIIYTCQKFDAAQTAHNTAHPQFKRRAMEISSDFLSKTVVVQLAFPLESESFSVDAIGEIFPQPTTVPEPEPEPEPTVPSAAGVAYAASQTSIYSGCEGTYANLTDGDGTTGAINGGESRTWIKASYAAPVLVAAVMVGGGQIPAGGLVAATGGLNNAKLQYSTDDVTWVDVLAISGVSDSGANQFKSFALATPITARYWRLESQSYLATTEFKFT